MQLEKIVLLKLNDKRFIPTLPKEMQTDKVLPLESEFKAGTQDLIRGFNPTVERLVLPDLIGLQSNEPEFSSKARDYWAEFKVIPTKEGLRLNIATEKKKHGTTKAEVKNEEGIVTGFEEIDDYIDFPVVPRDYAIYHIALQSSKVAKTESELSSLGNYDFYLVDLAAQDAKEAEEFNALDKADAVYMRLVNNDSIETNKEKINWVLELLRDKTEALDVEALDLTEKKRRLRKIKEEIPQKFTTTVEDKSLGTKAKIRRMLNYGVLTQEGKEIFDGEVNLGEPKNAVSWFERAENSQKVIVLEARLRNAVETKKTN